MPLWGSNGAAVANAPKYKLVPNVSRSNSTVNTTTMFGNTTPGAFVNNQVVGLYGVTVQMAQTAISNASHKTLNVVPGWYVVKSGMGPITGFAGLPIGTAYSNNDVVRITANGCTNATANVVTNSTGGIISLVVNTTSTQGGLFPNTAFPTVAITNTTGGTANGSGFTGVTVTLGGRAGRVRREPLVVIPSMTGNTTVNTFAFPNV